MARGGQFISAVGPLRIITALGVLFVLVGAGRSILISATGVPVAAALDGFILIGGPGLGLLYGRYWLSRSDIRPDVHPRIAAWCLGGIGMILIVLVLIELNPEGGIDRPFFTPFIGMALGSLAGFAIGVHEARSLSRAREAEGHLDRFRSERDLRERIVETSPVGISIVNADRSTRLVNERAAEIVGLSREELLELEYDESILETTDSEGNPIEEGVFRRVLRTGETIYDAERQFTRPDGQRVSLLVNGAPLHDRSGDVIGVIFAFADITERKQLEDELIKTVDRLEQSNDQLQQFAYAASHDLQEPLRMVSSYLQLLDTRYQDDLDADAREFIEFAVDGADRMRQMVDDLLAFARIEQDATAFEPVDCDAVIEQVLTALSIQIEESDAKIASESLPTVAADEQQLEQLFQNLVSNALKYSRDEAPSVEIGAERRDGYWEFAVADNGIGIDPNKTDQIFEVFKRLHTDDEYPGTGIGLALCQRIVERHGGDIWVESDPGEGSTFYFTIPAGTHRWEANQPLRSRRTTNKQATDN